MTGEAQTPTRSVRPEDEELAQRIGTRLREARRRAALTQQQLAAGRYTKAYVSALEHGIARPSMAALTFFAERLGVSPSALMGDDTAAWTRMEADLLLAAGRWEAAADAYAALVERVADAETRAELLRGVAEALTRLDRPAEAAAAAAEAAAGFRTAGRESDAILADYWLAYAEYEQGHATEARALLQSMLAKVRAGLKVEPAFNLRLLLALAAVDGHEGDHAAALGYLEEVRGLSATLDDRKRATYYYDLAHSYRETGDLEAAIRTGYTSLALFQSMEAEAETAGLENDLALAFVELGNLQRAEELAGSSRQRYERLHDDRALTHVLDTEARVALAKDEPERALELAARARELAEQTGNQKALIDALLTEARAHVALRRPEEAGPRYERAAALARSAGANGRLREVLRDWAALLASQGDHRRAYELTREALGN